MPTLAGITWAHNPIMYDYCLREAVASLRECCDEVIVLDAGSTDDSREYFDSLEDEKTTVAWVSPEMWDSQRGKEKLSYFQNLAAAYATSDYNLIIQADEVLHQDSIPFVRKAIEKNPQAVMCTRFNLWGSPYKYLYVPLDRQPCSPQVIRLAKSYYASVDDAENIGAPVDCFDFVNDIRIYHMGFVRDCRVMKHKVTHMQRDVFGMTPDAKLDGSEIFDWRKWFSEKDLMPIHEELPIYVQSWAKERDAINSKYNN